MADLPPVVEFAFPLPRAGDRQTVIDSAEEPVAIIEITDVRLMRLADVDLQIAIDEGEGFASVAEWRTAHEDFWNGYIDEYGWTLTDDTSVIVERFRLVERFGRQPGHSCVPC